jgi:hypothetical protein
MKEKRRIYATKMRLVLRDVSANMLLIGGENSDHPKGRRRNSRGPEERFEFSLPSD